MNVNIRQLQAQKAKLKYVTVRMYNVGFGDAFLLLLPTSEGTRKILIDCGVHAAGRNTNFDIKEVVSKIIEDVTDKGMEPYIDVVICTHRHQDHIMGFADARWSDVSVGEVWMPWTEDPKDSEARKLKSLQSRLATQLTDSFARRLLAPSISEPEKLRLSGLKDLAVNSMSNTNAMKTLHDGFSNNPLHRYLPPSQRKEHTFTTENLPGVVVHVLGPSRDPDVIRKMNPPAAQSYLAMNECASVGQSIRPFRESWAIQPPGFESAYPHLAVPARLKNQLDRTDTEAEELLAASLDQAVNGTSLMLMFQIGSAYLLFPGDAQWGTWQAAMQDTQWRELLGKTTFLKVGHHGSHNATPVEFVENILEQDNFQGMVSVQKIDIWKNIPRAPLMSALRDKSGGEICISQEEDDTPPRFRRSDDNKVIEFDVSV